MIKRSLAALGMASLFGLALGVAGIVPASAATTVTYNVTDRNDTAYSPSSVACVPAPALQVLTSCTLRAAIQQANMANQAVPGTATQINVPAGEFITNIASTSCTGDGDACGDFNVSAPVTITGAGQDSTIIDGNHKDRVFRVELGGDLTMSGVTIKNGNAAGIARVFCREGDDRTIGLGGGILVLGKLSLSASTVSGNHADIEGGGVTDAADGTLVTTLDHVTLSANTAPRGAGADQTVGNCFDISRTTVTGTLTIKNSMVTGNTASKYGAGVDEGGGGTVNVINSTVSRNVATNDQGNADAGGVAEDGTGTVTITGSTIDHNSSGREGGGVVEDGGGALTISHSVVSNNTAGGIAGGIDLSGGATTLTLDHLEVFGNRALGTPHSLDGTTNSVLVSNPSLYLGAGGGIMEYASGDATTMTDVYVHDNVASHGAGMYLDGGQPFSIDKLTLSNNSTSLLDNGSALDGFGAGILVDGGNSVTMINSTISGNTSAAQGGGAMWQGPAPTTNSAARRGHVQSPKVAATPPDGNLSFVTIADNRAASGGQQLQLVNKPTVNLRASIVSGAGSNCGGDASPLSQGYNLDSGSSCKFGHAGDQSKVDPLLAALGGNGGFEPTRALRAGSPAIDAVATACPPPATDQRGVTRPQQSACDAGAFEYVVAAAAGSAPANVPGLPPAGTRAPAGLRAVLGGLVAGAILLGCLAPYGWRRRRPPRVSRPR